MGIEPIGYLDISAWADLTRRAPTPSEVSLLRTIDAVFVAVMSEPDDE